MSRRRDISDKLIHFTRGENIEEAFYCLCNIIEEKQILATSTKIKGSFKCVCFSEAPLISLKDGLVNPDAYSRYSPFGILLEKRWLFGEGGRPVIYQTDEEYDLLPKNMQWRHVRYEPNAELPIDFTWEREWRIQTDSLLIDPSYAGIVLPDEEWTKRMIGEIMAQKEFEVLQYREMMDDNLLAEQYRNKFPWRIYNLMRNK